MNLEFSNRRLAGVLTVVPANEKSFIDEMDQFNFPRARSMKLKQVMGYDKHRLVKGDVCASDLIVFGFEHLFATGAVKRDEIDALVVITQSPDYLMPSTSSVVQGKLGLKQDMLCMDIPQGCAGFLIGLTQAFLLLDQKSIRKVAVANADVLSRKVSPRDRNSYPLIGDAASIAIVERSADGTPIVANVKMDGTRSEALMIPAGGFRLPSSPETAVEVQDAEGNFRAKDNLRMDGTAVFNFVQTEVPPMIESLFATAGKTSDDVDFFVFHQPNKFMLEKLADKMGVAYDKMPSNIVEHFGNSSGVTVPMVLTFNLRDRLKAETLRLCLAGFGVGLTWSSMLLDVGPLDFCEMLDFPDPA